MLNFESFYALLLNESRTPEDSLKFNEHKKSKDGKEITLEIVQDIYKADPSRNHAYVNWLIQLFTRMNLDTFLEDLYKATEYLTIFDKVKHKFEDIEARNIFNYKSLPEVYKVIEPYKENEEETLSKRQLRGDAKVEGEYELIYSDENWDVVIPLTHKASCFWGSGTQWCTAIDVRAAYYNNYTKDGPLYIFRHKTDKDERYQLHLERELFMDMHDSPVDFGKFIDRDDHYKLANALVQYWRENPEILEKASKNPVIKIIRSNDSDTRILELIVESGFDLNKEDSQGYTPLIAAILKDDETLLDYLIENGADPKKANSYGVTPVSAVVSHKYPGSDSTSDYRTLEILEFLFANGADGSGTMIPTSAKPMDARNTPTILSAIMNKKCRTALWLADKDGYDVNGTDSTNSNKASGKNLTLYLASLQIGEQTHGNMMSKEDIDIFVSTLAKKGLDLNTQTKMGNLNRTALHQAAYFAGTGKENMDVLVKALLENGADPWIYGNRSAYSPKASVSGGKVLAIQIPDDPAKRDKKVVDLLMSYMRKLKPNEPIPEYNHVAEKKAAPKRGGLAGSKS